MTQSGTPAIMPADQPLVNDGKMGEATLRCANPASHSRHLKSLEASALRGPPALNRIVLASSPAAKYAMGQNIISEVVEHSTGLRILHWFHLHDVKSKTRSKGEKVLHSPRSFSVGMGVAGAGGAAHNARTSSIPLDILLKPVTRMEGSTSRRPF